MWCRSPTSRKGMPQELEDKYFGNQEFTFINASWRGLSAAPFGDGDAVQRLERLRRSLVVPALWVPPACPQGTHAP